MVFYEPSSFGPDRSLGYLMRVINQAALARLEPLIAAAGMTNTQWQVLASIWFKRGVTCATLARDLTHDKGAMTRVIDGLEERGLLSRERDADDRRVVKLTLTEAGRAAVERGRDVHVESWNRWLEAWHDEDVETLIAMLQRLSATIEASPEGGG